MRPPQTEVILIGRSNTGGKESATGLSSKSRLGEIGELPLQRRLFFPKGFPTALGGRALQQYPHGSFLATRETGVLRRWNRIHEPFLQSSALSSQSGLGLPET